MSSLEPNRYIGMNEMNTNSEDSSPTDTTLNSLFFFNDNRCVLLYNYTLIITKCQKLLIILN